MKQHNKRLTLKLYLKISLVCKLKIWIKNKQLGARGGAECPQPLVDCFDNILLES